MLLNTCSIREKAQEKVFHQLGRWKKLKANKPDLVIGGAAASPPRRGQHPHPRPYVDIVFGPQTLHRLPTMIKQVQEGAVPRWTSPPRNREVRQPARAARRRATAFVSIMEGCSKYCSFCVVPYTRGEEVSRPLDDVLYEMPSSPSRACAK